MQSSATQQRHVVAAAYLGWTLDAFDFFIMVFVLSDIAKEFGTDITAVTWAITLTLAMRAVGAWIFGRVADRFGRRPTLVARRAALLDPRVRLRLCPEPYRVHHPARALRHRDGRASGASAPR